EKRGNWHADGWPPYCRLSRMSPQRRRSATYSGSNSEGVIRKFIVPRREALHTAFRLVRRSPMRHHWMLWAAVLALAAPSSAAAQDKQPDGSRPASTNVGSAQYPRIYADLRVTFQLKAPDAKKVQLQ